MGRYVQGENYVDAPSALVLRVTDDDIAVARQCEGNNCVLAVCVSRLFGPDTEVNFGTTRAFVKRPGSEETWRYVLPESVSTQIRAFDETGDFEPGLYELPVCRPSQRLGVPRPTAFPGSTGARRPNRRRRPLRTASRPRRTTAL